MYRFAAVVAQLENEDHRIKRDEKKFRDGIRALQSVLKEIADGAEAKGAAWACERAKRALIEAQEIDE